MKYYPIIHLLIILLGILFIYNGVSYLLTNVYIGFFSMINSSGQFGLETTIFYIIAALGSLFIGYFAIKNSKKICSWIGEKSGLNDGLKVISNSKELLSIFILFLALEHLLNYLPGFISQLFSFVTNLFPQRTDLSTVVNPTANYNWVENFLHLLFACLMIIFCGNLTNYFCKNLTPNSEFIISEENIESFSATHSFDETITENE